MQARSYTGQPPAAGSSSDDLSASSFLSGPISRRRRSCGARTACRCDWNDRPRLILCDCVERDEKAHLESEPLVQLFAMGLRLALFLEKADIAVQSIVLLQICFLESEVNHNLLEIFLSKHVNTIFIMFRCIGNMERRLQNMCAASFPLFLVIHQLLFVCAVWRPKIRFVVCSINVPSELIVQIFAFGESNGTRLLVVRCAPVISKLWFKN